MENNTEEIKKHISKEITIVGSIIMLLIGLCSIVILYRFDNIERLLTKPKQDTLAVNLPKNFNYAYDILKSYNKHIDTNTVIKITQTANYFSLSNNKKSFKTILGQLLAESGAKHILNDKVLTSNQGAIGIGQILPNSGYGYLIKRCTNVDRLIFKYLGCDDVSFVFNGDLSKSRKVYKMKEWLQDETNNIALWGFIMKKTIDLNHGNVNKALISYNSGSGGLQNYIDSGGSLKNHDYIVSINQKLNLNN